MMLRLYLTEKTCVFTETDGKGAPDGSCMDAMGYLRNAEWGEVALSVT